VVVSFFKAAFIENGFLDTWTMNCQDNFDFAKTQMLSQQLLIWIK